MLIDLFYNLNFLFANGDIFVTIIPVLLFSITYWAFRKTILKDLGEFFIESLYNWVKDLSSAVRYWGSHILYVIFFKFSKRKIDKLKFIDINDEGIYKINLNRSYLISDKGLTLLNVSLIFGRIKTTTLTWNSVDSLGIKKEGFISPYNTLTIELEKNSKHLMISKSEDFLKDFLDQFKIQKKFSV